MAGLTTGATPRLVAVARWALVAIAAGVVIGATVPAALRGLGVAWDANRLALPWLFERVLAFLAYLAMTGSVVYGLLLSTRMLDAVARRPISYALHRDLASIGLGLAAVHGTLLLLDRSIGFSLAQVVIPGQSPYEPLAVGFGQVALYLAAVVVASAYLRPHLGQRAWRTLHYLTFLAFAGATIHGIAAGTDSGTPWAQALYLGSATIVTFLLVYRIGLAVAGRAGQAPPSRAAAALAETRR